MANKRVRLYALSTCPACKRTAKFLQETGVQFEKIEVDTLDSGEQWLISKEVKKYNPEATYPTIVIEEVIVGYDEAGIKGALGL